MSIGYSALNRSLGITGDLTYRPQGDMRITNITQGTVTGATIQYADFSRKEIKLGYISTGAASVTYTVEITNYSNVEMGILKIDDLPSDAKITGYTLGTKLKDKNGKSDAGMVMTFDITFTSTKAETRTFLLKFDFENCYKVTYEGFTSTTGFKTEVLEKAKFTQNFGGKFPGGLPAGALYVTMKGSAYNDYTYSNGTITITSVTGPIDIKVLTASYLSYNNTVTGLNCSNVQCAIDEINKILDSGWDK